MLDSAVFRSLYSKWTAILFSEIGSPNNISPRQTLKATDATTLNIVLQYVQLSQPELSEHIMLLRPDVSSAHTTPTAQLVATLHEKLFVG